MQVPRSTRTMGYPVVVKRKGLLQYLAMTGAEGTRVVLAGVLAHASTGSMVMGILLRVEKHPREQAHFIMKYFGSVAEADPAFVLFCSGGILHRHHGK